MKIKFVWLIVSLFAVSMIVLILIYAVRRQSNMTPSYSKQARDEDARVFAESTKVMEATVAEALAAKARDPRLAEMSQEDLVYEVLKECFDPEIPLNVVDLGLIYEVKAGTDAVDVKMSVTSPACPSGATIAEDIRSKLSNAGFPNPNVQIVMEPAWSPQRISEAGRKTLGIN
ncbi:MAG TPA: iron-sulfur cluster assembly protein [Terriglobia bacterium]